LHVYREMMADRSVAAAAHPLCPGHVAKPCAEEPDAIISHVQIRGSCALKAHGIQAPERAPPAKLSSQSGTESCVVIGNEHHEA
jgi:hypothetical protein